MSGVVDGAGHDTPPHERLESWRFVVAEAESDESRQAGLLRWMQEVEDQLANLRDRLNGLPNEFARRPPVW